MVEGPVKFKEFVLSKITNVPKEVSNIVKRTKLDSISLSELKMRLPWDILIKDIAERNVCIDGDALHPMTPDIGQCGCSVLEDNIILASCIGESFKKILKRDIGEGKEDVEGEMAAIYEDVEKYAKYRRWRSFSLITTACVVGFVHESEIKLICFLREIFLSKYTIATMMRMADFDCGKLDIS